jgi:hypothetical protein
MKQPNLTDEQKRRAARCVELLSEFNGHLAALSSGVEAVTETLCRLGNGERVDFDAEYDRMLACSTALATFDERAMQIMMVETAALFSELFKEKS